MFAVFLFPGKSADSCADAPGNKRNRVRGCRTFSFLRSDACGSKEISRTSRGQFRISFRKPFPHRQNIAALIAIFSTSQTPFSQKHELRGENRLIFIGRPASASHFESRINRKCARLQTNGCSLFCICAKAESPKQNRTQTRARNAWCGGSFRTPNALSTKDA